jgi:hypothetical protein
MISGLVRAMPTCSNLALMASNLFSISPFFRAQRYDFAGRNGLGNEKGLYPVFEEG